MFCIVAFHTEGRPHDFGKDLSKASSLFRSSAEPFCDLYLSHTPSTLCSSSPEHRGLLEDCTLWLDSHPERDTLRRFNSEWTRLGFMRWKSLLVKATTRLVPEGAIVMYHDVDCIKYPQYLVGVEEWRDLSEAILNEVGSDIFMPYENALLETGCKRHLLDKYDIEGIRPSLWSGVFIFRNSESSLRFASEWIEMSSLDNSSPLPDGGSSDRLFWHSPDQSIATILSDLWKRRGLLDGKWPRFCFADRVVSSKTLVEFK